MTDTQTAAQKAIERLAESIDSGDLYQALQLFKTQHARAKKRGDVAQATELALRGAKLFLERNQVNSGSELARDYIELVTNSSTDAAGKQQYDNSVTGLLEIDLQFAREENMSTEEGLRERKRFLKLAIEYTAAKGPWPQGEPELHLNFARMGLKEKNLLEATKHYVHANKVDEFSDVLVAWASTGPESERDLYLARGVLQLLCYENLGDANLLNVKFRKDCSGLEITPLLRFVDFLLRTLERDAYPLFQVLRQKYAPSIARAQQPNAPNPFDMYLDKIALVFYGVQPPKSGMGNMMDMLMKGLF
ncbi:hypothetical protein BASA81_010984 [Batrachochytrium salamandrivorans]|nr:hypothetical protein BASA81_010984 [Batrachochytrium salamandrivorans]